MSMRFQIAKIGVLLAATSFLTTCVQAQSMIALYGSSAYYVATDQTVHEAYVSNGQWVDLNITAATGTSSRVEVGAGLTMSNAAPYYVATDLTIHQMYTSNGQWIDFNITAGTGTAARVLIDYTISGQVLARSSGLPGAK